MIIGSHVSFGKDQLLGSAKMAASYGANTFMFYTGAPQNTIRADINADLIDKAKKFMQGNNIDINNVICHAPYIINLANKEKVESWNFSIAFLKNEISRITKMGINYIVVHPGNALKLDKMEALANISEAINYIIDENTLPMILLETMAGKGSECGINLYELKEIYNNINLKDKVGFCLDTCHLNDSGVDIAKFDDYLIEFDNEIGIDKIKCIHINDSKNIIGAHKDRHANIGFGTIGFDNLINVIYNSKLKDVPKILETPYINDYPPYKFEIDMIMSKKFNANLEKSVIDYYKNELNF
ncbi:MAG: deoxyribonuclease IV [Bacilli bacterium]